MYATLKVNLEEAVPLAVMPRGVEHLPSLLLAWSKLEVPLAVMPRGVEHSTISGVSVVRGPRRSPLP